MAERILTHEQAEEYFRDSRPDSAEWSDAESDEQLRTLLCAENILLAVFPTLEKRFNDSETSEYHIRMVRMAVCEEAIHLLQTGALRSIPELMMGIQSASAGPLSVTFSKEFNKPLVSDYARLILTGIGLVMADANTVEAGRIVF